MRRLLQDKDECSSLALDGMLADRDEIHINPQDFLEGLAKTWKTPLNVLDEHSLQRTIVGR